MDVIEAKSFKTLDSALKWIYILSKKKAFGYSGGGSKKKDMAMSLYQFLDLLFFTARQEGIRLGLIKEDEFEPNLMGATFAAAELIYKRKKDLLQAMIETKKFFEALDESNNEEEGDKDE